MKSKILLIEDDESFYLAISLLLQDSNINVVWADCAAKGIQIFKQDPYNFAAVIIDYMLPDLKGTEVCQHLRTLNSDQEFLFASGHFEVEYLTDQLETGASGFLKKGSPSIEIKNKIISSVQKYNQKNKLLSSSDHTPNEIESNLKKYDIIGQSAVMQQMLKETEAAKNSDYPTLIIGESGTGKELIANALLPKGKKIIAINCASFLERENLLESELFGYVKGAFTGANADTLGLVAKANGNILFLDELHQLPLSGQAKLLRFLQEMKYRRVGDNSGAEIKVNFKLIAAVQPDIKQRLIDKTFLTDLYERVGTLIINVPALRDRIEDVNLLATHFQTEFNKNKELKSQKQIRISTLTEMKKQSWPTNIRGLQNAIKQMMTNCEGDIINPIDFKNYLSKVQTTHSGDMNTEESTLDHESAIKNFEINHIISILKKCKTRSEAALRLGLPLATLMRKINQFGIDPSFYLMHS